MFSLNNFNCDFRKDVFVDESTIQTIKWGIFIKMKCLQVNQGLLVLRGIESVQMWYGLSYEAQTA